MGQHKIAARNHGQRPTTHKPSIGWFNKSRSNYLHISSEIAENPMKAKTLELLNAAKAKLSTLRPGDADYDKTSREVAVYGAQYNVMPDRVAMKGTAYRIGRNELKRTFKQVIVDEANALRTPTGRVVSDNPELQEFPRN